MSHIDILVKDGVVRIPSIFMFEDILGLELVLNQARQMNCTVVFENEEFELPPHWENTDARFVYYVYRSIVSNRKIGNAYLRYLGNIDKMTWDKVEKV